MKNPVIHAALTSFEGPSVRFEARAEDLLRRFEKLGTIFDASHVVNQEIRTQIELLKHAMHHDVPFHLHDDHWSRTCFVFLELLEEGKAWIADGGAKKIGIADLKKEPWANIQGPLSGVGGQQYLDLFGRIVFRTQTWRS
jgi:hypothetical protein